MVILNLAQVEQLTAFFDGNRNASARIECLEDGHSGLGFYAFDENNLDAGCMFLDFYSEQDKLDIAGEWEEMWSEISDFAQHIAEDERLDVNHGTIKFNNRTRLIVKYALNQYLADCATDGMFADYSVQNIIFEDKMVFDVSIKHSILDEFEVRQITVTL